MVSKLRPGEEKQDFLRYSLNAIMNSLPAIIDQALRSLSKRKREQLDDSEGTLTISGSENETVDDEEDEEMPSENEDSGSEYNPDSDMDCEDDIQVLTVKPARINESQESCIEPSFRNFRNVKENPRRRGPVVLELTRKRLKLEDEADSDSGLGTSNGSNTNSLSTSNQTKGLSEDSQPPASKTKIQFQSNVASKGRKSENVGKTKKICLETIEEAGNGGRRRSERIKSNVVSSGIANVNWKRSGRVALDPRRKYSAESLKTLGFQGIALDLLAAEAVHTVDNKVDAELGKKLRISLTLPPGLDPVAFQKVIQWFKNC